jgi:uncharacterized protein (TIGR02391 family)
VNRLSDAWCWLEANALLVRDPSQTEAFRRVSRDGRDLVNDPQGITRFEARERLSGPLHPALEGTVRTSFHLGDYETACFAAMKAVEVAVRNASGLDNSLVGVHLMRAAFQPHKNGKGGALADAGAEGGEQEAASALFAGAMGAFKNPPAIAPSTSTTRSRRPRLSSSRTCCCGRSNVPSADRPRQRCRPPCPLVRRPSSLPPMLGLCRLPSAAPAVWPVPLCEQQRPGMADLRQGQDPSERRSRL